MALSLSHILQLISFSVLLTCGQLLFKISATAVPNISSLEGLFALLNNFWFYIAIAVYGISTLLWIFILQQVPLSHAYPFVALGFVIIPVLSWIIFQEPLNIFYVGGIALILAGLALITLMGAK